MLTKLIEGVAPRADDQKLLALIEKHADPWGGGGMPMTLGIVGPEDRVYRVIRADGMGEWMMFVQALKSAGLTDSGASPFGRNTLDATFR
jgi:hypothetical protein